MNRRGIKGKKLIIPVKTLKYNYMLNFFKSKKQHELDVELLNNSKFKCGNCHVETDLSLLTPLTLEKCASCGQSNFVPYLIKDYWLYKPLGGGGMGSVYEAVHRVRSGIFYAVKILPRASKDDPRLINALIREAEIGKQFGRHPHLVPVADYGLFGDEYFCAMEFSEGKRLDEIIESNEPISHKFILLWALQILSAEQRIYDCGYLYRDIKPQNIIIDPFGNVHLFDYGLCLKIEDAAKSQGEMVDGSPIYMPPERIIGAPENASGEIYSLGMVLFHALSGKTYYSATDAYRLAQKHVTSIRFANVASRLPNKVSPKICEFLDKMLERAPSARYQSFKEAAVAIKKVYSELQ